MLSASPSYRKFFLLFLLMAVSGLSYATHYRAGEITYQRLNDKLYRITAITYTDPRQPANENTRTLSISWGDGKYETINRTSSESINSKIQRNVYVADHAFGSYGTYLISFADPNRVSNILNINGGNSVNVPFYVECFLRINNSIGSNESPILYVPPIDEGCKNFVYVHNPGAYDADGDSLSYELIPPKQAPLNNVPNYSTPIHSDSFTLNKVTGQLTWASPEVRGTYNIAIRINEYRNNILVGYVVRDMQIEINDCPNAPPLIASLPDLCIKAGTNYTFIATATDPNPGQIITLRGYAGPFEQPSGPASMNPDPAVGVSFVSSQFRWQTNGTHIRYFSHQGIIKATDNYISPSADIKPFRIKVNGPAPKNLQTKQQNNGFLVSWEKDSCGLANKYLLYRKIDSSNWSPGACETGIPANLGYKLIATLNKITDTSYLDTDNGKGLSPLVNYCYRVVAVFPARDRYGKILYSYDAESYASTEICDAIIRSKPLITRVSVNHTSITNGAIAGSWLRPDTLDTIQFPPPYRLVFSRSLGQESPYQNFDTIEYANLNAIRDSVFYDTLINTSQNQVLYQIKFYSLANGGNQLIDISPVASSLRTSVYSTDKLNILNWNANVPWSNTGFVVYRQNTNLTFDSIGYTTTNQYRDEGLVNKQTYCYLVKSFGKYSLLPDTTENYSQEICGTPIDTIRPCPPDIRVTAPCADFVDFTNKIEWYNKPGCANDVVSFNVYYKAQRNDTGYIQLAKLPNTSSSFQDSRELLKKGIAGCYVVTGVDSFNNESHFLNEFCIDNCPEYRIPNVFTPNGDGLNDLLRPFPYRFIEKIDFKIYNRWGKCVFETEDLDIGWDGKDKDSGKDCHEGVYFYTCKVYEKFLDGLKARPINGTIQLMK